jgi:hypothetical protein
MQKAVFHFAFFISNEGLVLSVRRSEAFSIIYSTFIYKLVILFLVKKRNLRQTDFL